jgi:hypothetical protein
MLSPEGGLALSHGHCPNSKLRSYEAGKSVKPGGVSPKVQGAKEVKPAERASVEHVSVARYAGS